MNLCFPQNASITEVVPVILIPFRVVHPRYEATILADDELEMVLDSADADGDAKPDLYIKHSDTSKFVFMGLPFLLAAALGGLYEAIWKRREIRASSSTSKSSSRLEEEEEEENRPGILAFLHNVVHYQLKPLGRYSP